MNREKTHHQTLLDAKVIIEDLGDRRQAVGGARRVGHDLHLLVVLLLVDADDKGRRVVARRRDNDLLGTLARHEVSGRRLDGLEDTGGLADVVDTALGPGDLLGRLLVNAADLLAVDDEVLLVELDSAGELAVHGVIAELVRHVFRVEERVVDGADLDALGESSAQNETTNAAEAVDTKSDGHGV
jgi:hypothetical protein